MMYETQTLILKQTFVPYTQQLSKNAFRNSNTDTTIQTNWLKGQILGWQQTEKDIWPFVRQELARQHFGKHNAQLTSL